MGYNSVDDIARLSSFV